jgi:hypothetical protein
MTEMIDSIDAITQRDEVIDKVHIPPTVFSQPVNNEQYCSWLTFREPALIIDVGISITFEESLLVFHFSTLFFSNSPENLVYARQRNNILFYISTTKGEGNTPDKRKLQFFY